MGVRTIWKFEIEIEAEQEVRVGDNARIVHVATQRETPYVWVEHEPQPDHTERTSLRFAVVGTGAAVPDGRYAGCFMLANAALVFHVYELGGRDG